MLHTYLTPTSGQVNPWINNPLEWEFSFIAVVLFHLSFCSHCALFSFSHHPTPTSTKWHLCMWGEAVYSVKILIDRGYGLCLHVLFCQTSWPKSLFCYSTMVDGGGYRIEESSVSQVRISSLWSHYHMKFSIILVTWDANRHPRAEVITMYLSYFRGIKENEFQKFVWSW